MSLIRTLAGRSALLLSAFTALTPLSAAALRCTVAGADNGIVATPSDGIATLAWSGTDGDRMVLRVDATGGAPRLSLTVNDVAVVRDAGLSFDVTSAMRRMSGQQLDPLRKLGVTIDQHIIDKDKWDAFWDAPLNLDKPDPKALRETANQPPIEGVANQPGLPRAATEISRSTLNYAIDRCAIERTGARASITLSGVGNGVFKGALRVTVYRGTNLIRVEFVASTDKPSVAYKYDAGLTGLPIAPDAGVAWHDTANGAQRDDLGGAINSDKVAVSAANRILEAESGTGASVAILPPPHTYFWAREIETNVGNNWFRKDAGGRFAIGIRQADREVRDEYRANWALYSAPPGSEQHMAFYLFPAAGDGERARQGALAFTRGDHFAPLPGYKVMAHHYHLGMGERLIASGSVDTRLRDFEVLRDAGIDIVSVTDVFPDQRNPGGPKRLEVMKAYFDGVTRSSDGHFLIMPDVESFNIMGGHTDFLMRRPVLWLEHRAPGQPLKTEEPGLGTVYHVGTPDDVMQMVRETGMLLYMPHPRTKGSTGYPDAIAKGAAWNSDAYRGIGWRWGMGSDLSEKRLSEKRVLPLYDEINNWAAAAGERPKYILSIAETFDKEPGDDVYANDPVNYVKLDAIPRGADYAPVIDALNRGDSFVTSGEVLISDLALEANAGKRSISADLQWTFPLDIVEAVWGDGKTVHREMLDPRDQPAFGKHRFTVPIAAGKIAWVRFAAWDSAGNGAMSQPIAIAPPKR